MKNRQILFFFFFKYLFWKVSAVLFRLFGLELSIIALLVYNNITFKSKSDKYIYMMKNRQILFFFFFKYLFWKVSAVLFRVFGLELSIFALLVYSDITLSQNRINIYDEKPSNTIFLVFQILILERAGVNR